MYTRGSKKQEKGDRVVASEGEGVQGVRGEGEELVSGTTCTPDMQQIPFSNIHLYLHSMS